jgi:NCK-associated protein 1
MVSGLLQSVLPVLEGRQQSADVLRKAHFLSIAHAPAQLAQPACPDTLHLVPLSLAHMARWVALGFLLVPNELAGDELGTASASTSTSSGDGGASAPSGSVFDRLLTVLADLGALVPLFRNESLAVHAAYEVALSSARDAKRLTRAKNTVVEHVHAALAAAPASHASRRVYLRQSLGQLVLLLRDRPALLAPKLPVVLLGATLARDEVLWLVRHHVGPLPKHKARLGPEAFVDPDLPELLHVLFSLQGFVSYVEI